MIWRRQKVSALLFLKSSILSVSYTHLDVYKRQEEAYRSVCLSTPALQAEKALWEEYRDRRSRLTDTAMAVSYTHLDVYKRQS